VVEKPVVIIGTGGMGRETLWILQASGREVAGFVTSDEEQHGTTVEGAHVHGSEDRLVGWQGVEAVCAIGDPRHRRRVTQMLESEGVRFTSAIHPSAVISPYARLGDGCIVCPGVVITTQVRLGAHVIVNVHASISHDACVDDFATIGPGARITGGGYLEAGAEMGVSAAVLPRKKVGSGAVVGAGAVVLDDIPANAVAVGVPAKVIRQFAEDEWF